ncbi:Ropporin-1-like protein [Rhizophlyctis rosea]|nr:Ropporin-1-like protein [Rhizophlyctis rosea]
MADVTSRPTTSDPLKSTEPVRVPADLPDILKAYTKHIIKTQPKDILASSADRLARQKATTGDKLDIGHLESFYSKFYGSEKKDVNRRDVDDAARTAGVQAGQVTEAVSLGAWTRDAIPWLKLWTLLCAATSGTFLSTVMTVCDIMGDKGKVMTAPVIEVLQYLSTMDQNVDQAQVDAVVRSLSNHQIYPIDDIIALIHSQVQPCEAPFKPKPPLADAGNKQSQETEPAEEEQRPSEAHHEEHQPMEVDSAETIQQAEHREEAEDRHGREEEGIVEGNSHQESGDDVARAGEEEGADGTVLAGEASDNGGRQEQQTSQEEPSGETQPMEVEPEREAGEGVGEAAP